MDHVPDHVQSDTASGDLGHTASRRETGQEQKFQKFRFTQVSYHRCAGQASMDNFVAESLHVDPSTVVTHPYGEHPGMVVSLKHDRAVLRFACSDAVLWQLEAVIHTVPQQVVQRRFQLAQDIAIDCDVASLNLEAGLFAQRFGEISNHPGKRDRALAEGPHATADHFVIECCRSALAAPQSLFQVRAVFLQYLFGPSIQPAQFIQFGTGHTALYLSVQVVQEPRYPTAEVSQTA